MPTLNDPQNPVRFVANDKIPTVLDKTKVNYGLAQGIADGPLSRGLGVFVRGQIPTLVTTPTSPSPVSQLGGFLFVPEAGVRSKSPA